jgi:hypothetical protein
LIGFRVAAGELVGVTVALAWVATGLDIGNTNAGDGEAWAVADAPDEGDVVALGDTNGLCVGAGLGEGGMIFSQ